MNERLAKVISHPMTIPISVGVVSFGTGVGLGFILGRRKNVYLHLVPEPLEFDLQEEDLAVLEEIIDEDDEQVIVTNINVDEFVKTKLKEAEIVLVEEEPEVEVVAETIFAGTDDEWNYTEEIEKRSSANPYVLHKDEFYAEELGYSQTTLTYYSGDNIMVDQDDTPVYNFSMLVGPLLFGHGSGDPNVFYVRNDKQRAEYEILFDRGLYSVEVLGLEIEDNARVKDIKHASHRKFKLD